jgi:hypothetical protein
MPEQEEILATIARFAEADTDPTEPLLQLPDVFRAAAVEVFPQIARLRFERDGGNLEEFDVVDSSMVIDLRTQRTSSKGCVLRATGDALPR